MTRTNEWATKVLGLIKGGNTPAALAQIKVAPSVKDLRQLQTALSAADLATRHPLVAETIADHIDALSSPRLHRSP